MKRENGWAIAGPHGLYTGWWQTRAQAICGHLIGYHGGNAAATRGLTDAERQRWKRRKADGDRCVRVTLTYK